MRLVNLSFAKYTPLYATVSVVRIICRQSVKEDEIAEVARTKFYGKLWHEKVNGATQ
ncbi:MAG: hypothetical protein PGMFKBFP_01860 [Anaerolineales bacterium]|nr:hypothetical protein [Anaerolineales bacterium]